MRIGKGDEIKVMNRTQSIEKKKEGEVHLAGKIISPGIAMGKACMEESQHEIARYRIQLNEIEAELGRLAQAKNRLQENLKQHIRLAHDASDEDLEHICKVHEMMLQDESFFSRIKMDIQKENKNTEWAIMDQADSVIARFESAADPYLQARSEDIRDLAESLLLALDQEDVEGKSTTDLQSPAVLISNNLYVTSAVRARKLDAIGYATESPAVLSHGAILLKGMGIPVLGDVENIESIVQRGDEIILDALAGKVIIRPSPSTRQRYYNLKKQYESTYTQIDRRPFLTKTRNGIPVHLYANIEHPNQVSLVLRNRLEGVGLFRTEFLVLGKKLVPDEEEQYNIYKSIYDQLDDHSVIVRTLDIGADKQTTHLHRCTGRNPAMGIRGIRRHILREQEEIEVQLRAVLRASKDREAQILFPLITNLADVRKAKHFVLEARKQLADSKIPHAKRIKIGAMVEVPSAVFIVDDILREVDFISIGTNDLMQYFSAADRDNRDVLFYQDACDPSFQRLLKYLAKQVGQSNRLQDVTICGEIASSPEMIPLLLEMGYCSFSISPIAADSIRQTIAQSSPDV